VSYAGDSNAKKILRAEYWLKVSETCARLDGLGLPPGRHLALAGPDAADARVARAFGFSAIELVERDPQAARRTRERLDSFNLSAMTTLIEADLSEVLDREPGAEPTHRSILLDFCGNLSGETLKLLHKAILCVQTCGVLGVVVLKGREYEDTLVHGMPNRAERRRMASVCGHEVLSPRLGSAIAHGSEMKGAVLFGANRAFALEGALSAWLRPWGELAHLACVNTYKGHASPMMFAIYQRAPDAIVGEWQKTRNLREAMGNYPAGKPTDDEMRRIWLDEERRSGFQRTTDMFNLDPARCSAWKAVRTRQERGHQGASGDHERSPEGGS
jgi:hypothetical protein